MKIYNIRRSNKLSWEMTVSAETAREAARQFVRDVEGSADNQIVVAEDRMFGGEKEQRFWPQELEGDGPIDIPTPVVQGSTANEAERFPALRTISGIYRFLAVLCVVAGIVVTFVGAAIQSKGGPGLMLIFLGTLGGTLGGILGAIGCLAVAEGILVVLAIERNTRTPRLPD